MRFVSVNTAAGPRLGVVGEDDLVCLAVDDVSLADHLGDDGEKLARLSETISTSPSVEAPLESLTLLAPLSPSGMRDFMTFEEHLLPAWRADGRDRGPDVWYEWPVGYFSNVASLLGPYESVEIPGGSECLDFELEVATIVGREARSVTPDEAAAHIAGFLILCDWSARDIQFREIAGRLGPFKGKDFASSLGPVFVTADELADRRSGSGYDLAMTAKVNDRVYGTDRWSSAMWSVEELVSYASWNTVVPSGTLLGSGTCQGGCIRELALRHGPTDYPWLQPGDQVTLTVERLGAIDARVEPAARGAWPGSRTVDHRGT